MALQLALIEKVNTDGPDVFLISTKGLGDVRNRAVAVLFDMAQELVCKLLPNSWQLLCVEGRRLMSAPKASKP